MYILLFFFAENMLKRTCKFNRKLQTTISLLQSCEKRKWNRMKYMQNFCTCSKQRQFLLQSTYQHCQAEENVPGVLKWMNLNDALSLSDFSQ
jgi:hypothetical protein